MAQMGKSEGGPQPEAPPSYFQATEGLPPAGPIPITPAGPVPGTHHANQAQQQGPTIVTTVGRHTAHMICPSCHAEVDSATEKKPGPTAYFCGTFIVLLGCWCGCCLIPCCIDDCMEVHHTCPNCKANLGKYRK